MTAPSRLTQLANEVTGRPQKGVAPAISAALSLTTSFQNIITYTGGVEAANGGAWIDIGNAPGVDITLEWTHDTGETLTLLTVFSPSVVTADPTVGAPAPYIPSVAATGTTPAIPQQVTFTKTNWSTTTSPMSSATVKYLRCYANANGCRLVKLMAMANAGTATVVAYVSAGTMA